MITQAVNHARNGFISKYVLVGFVVVFSLVLAAVAVMTQSVHDSAERTQCHANISWLANGTFWCLVTRAKPLGCLPPPSITDLSGKPLYSWRVIALATCDGCGRSLVEEFDYTKPWNDPHNLQLLEGNEYYIENVFACPSAAHSKPGHVDYYYALNVNDRWPQDFFTDVLPPRIILEVPGLDAYWSEPVDFVFDKGPDSALNKLRQSRPLHRVFHATQLISEAPLVHIPVRGGQDRELGITKFFDRQPIEQHGVEVKERTDKLVANLTKLLAEQGQFGFRVRALLLLGELGPKAKKAIPVIHDVMREGDARMTRVAKFALAKIEKE